MWLWIAFSQFGDFPLWPVFGHDWNFVCCRTHCTAQKRKTEFNWNCCQVGTLNSNQNKNKRSESWQSLCKEGIPRKNVITIQTKINKQKTTQTLPPPQKHQQYRNEYSSELYKAKPSPIPALQASQQPWSRPRSHKEYRIVPVYEDLTSISCSLV